MKEKIQSQSAGVDPYFQAVFVFTSAYLDTKARRVGQVDCVRDDRLRKYLEEGKSQRRLSPEAVKSLSAAFARVARMGEPPAGVDLVEGATAGTRGRLLKPAAAPA